MKHYRLILSLILIPALICGMHHAECKEIYGQMLFEKQKHADLLQERELLEPFRYTKEALPLLEESLLCCQKAIAHCNTLLDDIEFQPKAKRKKEWRVTLKKKCKENKQELGESVTRLVKDIEKTKAYIASDGLYQLSLEKEILAKGKESFDCEVREEVASLYDEAAVLASQALEIISPYGIEGKQMVYREEVNRYRDLGKFQRQETARLGNLASKKHFYKDKIAGLQQQLQEEHKSAELQKQALFLLEQLVNVNSVEELQVLKEELAQLKELVLALEQTVEEGFFGTKEWKSDVRSCPVVVDAVNPVTGSFMIDEMDLELPGSFPVSIRRNYNSQNPLMSDFGCGWKLGLNPFLIEQEGKRFAAEMDGTVIAYRYNQGKDRWEVLPEDNPELSYCEGNNPFHAYIEGNVLYGADGSQRYFEEGLLLRWMNHREETVHFTYENRRLVRIKNGNGDSIGLKYNEAGKIEEIDAKEGRRVLYDYDAKGNLVKITYPNGAEKIYEYDLQHRIVREIKPHGKVLEHIYDDEGRVKEQRMQVGFSRDMFATKSFDYADGMTIVRDARGGKTIFKFFEKQVYKIINSLGFITSFAWFIDESSWFDPDLERVVAWNQEGGAVRCLKSKTDVRGLTTYYQYDRWGNPEIVGLKGEDLSGNGLREIVTKRRYNERHLCIEEEMGDHRTKTIYEGPFAYLPKRIEKYVGTVLCSSTDYSYSRLGQVLKEECSGATVHWKHDSRGLPIEKREVTGTVDPDVLSTYVYDKLGHCVEIHCADHEEKRDYDLMGNVVASKRYSLGGELISATSMSYDLNNRLTWEQPANGENGIYFDYHPSGLLKSKKCMVGHNRSAYTLYEYDAFGNLIEETDARGYTTYRYYDALGQMTSETKEGYTTVFAYEPGGLVESVTTPTGAQTKRRYTTQGLLKEEEYPDGTKHTWVYDYLGRIISETNGAVKWETTYDDAQHQKVRKGPLHTEIFAFDERGNLIRFTDPAGFTTEMTYDGLDRMKSEKKPSGLKTEWSYRGNTIFCTHPNQEVTKTVYAGGEIVQSEDLDTEGRVRSKWMIHRHPATDFEEVIEGDKKTLTWLNGFGLPVKVVQGGATSTFEYDQEGNCTAYMNQEGVTRQTFDGLGRMTQKELPDGSFIRTVYDPDSRIIETHHSNGASSFFTYDLNGRKTREEKRLNGAVLTWEFVYENGVLTKTIDDMQRVHDYTYDALGRITEEKVGHESKMYTYDPRGLQTRVEQNRENTSYWPTRLLFGSNRESTIVEKSYDEDGRLTVESTYLNGQLLQQSKQTWNGSSHVLQIGDHVVDLKASCVDLPTYSVPPPEMGQKEWDAWGRLIKVFDGKISWEASYDPFGRKLQTRVTPHWQTQEVRTHFYDPEQPDREIGVKIGDKMVWFY